MARMLRIGTRTRTSIWKKPWVPSDEVVMAAESATAIGDVIGRGFFRVGVGVGVVTCVGTGSRTMGSGDGVK